MKKKIYLTGFVLCMLLFVVSLYQVIHDTASARNAEEAFTHLAEVVELAEEPGGKTPKRENPEGENQSPLEQYQEIFQQNNELAGWVSIDGTNINYPVMYTPEKPDFYLKHNFEKAYSAYGVPYIAEHCSPFEPSDNILIYGHHMKNGSMFTGLLEYEDKAFYEKHKTIRFDTLTEQAEYEVIAVFKTTVYDEAGLPFYLFADADTEKAFQDYVDACQSISLYDTAVTAKYGDKLVTLSTCEYSQKNGRFVVVAKKKKGGIRWRKKSEHIKSVRI